MMISKMRIRKAKKIPTGKPADLNPNTSKGTSGGFNMPISPVNQFGQLDELKEAIENKDWDTVEEFCEEIGGLPEEVVNSIIDIAR